MLDAGGAVEIRRMALLGRTGAELLANGDFSAGLAHWWPVAQKYFVPWHIDNLYLELLIDRGLPALLVFVMLAALGLARSSARTAALARGALCRRVAVRRLARRLGEQHLRRAEGGLPAAAAARVLAAVREPARQRERGC